MNIFIKKFIQFWVKCFNGDFYIKDDMWYVLPDIVRQDWRS